MVRQAWKTMVTGRPGPVVLDVPFDIFKEAAAEETPRPEEWSANISSRCGADPEGVTKAVDMLLAAERPVILVGQGVRYGGATADLLALAETLQIPVAHRQSGIGAIDTSHPLSLGLVSRGGVYQANHAARQADVLLALGVRFDDRTSSSWIPGYSFTIPPTKLIHVDIDPDEIGRNYPVALGLMADVRTFLRQVLAELATRNSVADAAASRRQWLAAIDGLRQRVGQVHRAGLHRRLHADQPAARRRRDRPRAARRRHPGQRHRRAPQLAAAVLQAEAAGQLHRLHGLRRRWVLASPACSAPSSRRPTGRACRCAATARSSCTPTCSAPRSSTICRSSGWSGTITPMRRSAACSAAILDGRELATDFKHPETGEPYNPDFAAMARSAGVEGVRVDRAGDLGDAIRAAIAANKPYLIDVNISADQNPGGAGVWELPGLGVSKVAIGGRYQP